MSNPNSLSQGMQFIKPFRGGKSRRYRLRGGSAEYPNSFQTLLPAELHNDARITAQDNAFAQLPSFYGKYGTMTGGKKKSRRMRGGMAPASVNSPAMLLNADQASRTFLNPQWTNENLVVPSFKGPDNSQVQVQKAGAKRSRKNRSTRKHKNRSTRNRK